MNQFILPVFYGIFLTLNIAMNNTILQWNCRSIKANFEELTLLINEQKPVAVCLQETFLKDSDKFTLKYHSCYFKIVLVTIKLQEVLLSLLITVYHTTFSSLKLHFKQSQ